MALGRDELIKVKRSQQNVEETYWFGNKEVKVNRTLDLPVNWGIHKLYIRTGIANENIPWLLGNQVLKKMGAVLDLEKKILKMMNFGNKELKIVEVGEGHIGLDMIEYKGNNKIWLNTRNDSWVKSEKEWKLGCEKLHLQFGHGSYDKLKDMIEKTYRELREFKDNKEEKLKILKETCEKCKICQKFERTPSRLVVGMNVAEKFNEVLCVDIGELDGEKFLVMVDWSTRYSQASWVRNKRPIEII